LRIVLKFDGVITDYGIKKGGDGKEIIGILRANNRLFTLK
jgi:hypothetical protein